MSNKKIERQKVKAERKKMRAERSKIRAERKAGPNPDVITVKDVQEIAMENLRSQAPDWFASMDKLKDAAEMIKDKMNDWLDASSVKDQPAKQVVADADDSFDKYFNQFVDKFADPPEFKFALRQDLEDTGKTEFLPAKAEPHASGYDVRAAFYDYQSLILTHGMYFKIPLGFRSLPPEGWYYQLYPRSSSFLKKHMHNLIGIIDESYSNEVLFVGQFLANNLDITERLIINFGDCIGQIIPMKRIDMKVVSVSNQEYDDFIRRKNFLRFGGFGSTG